MFEPTYNSTPFSECPDEALEAIAAGRWFTMFNDTGIDDELVNPIYRALASVLLMERAAGAGGLK